MRRAVTRALLVGVLGAALSASAAWAVSPGVIAFTGVTGGRVAMWSVRPDGSAAHKLVAGSSGTLSRDGKTLAFLPTLAGVATAHADGSRVHLLTHGSFGTPTQVLWSPSGRQLAVLGGAAGQQALYVVSVPGGAAKRIYSTGTGTSSPTIFSPSWSPDGKRIAAFIKPPGNSGGEVVTIDATSGTATAISHNVTSDTPTPCTVGATQNDLAMPVWGSAGIATLTSPMTCNQGGGYTAWNAMGDTETLADTAGDVLRTLDAGPGAPEGYGGAWSPDGHTLLLTSGDVTRSHGTYTGPLYTVPAGGGRPRRLGTVQSVALAPVSWSR
jgi:hypothetical protein